MDRGLALVLTLAVGGAIALQPPSNALMARVVGDVPAAFMSLIIATVVVGVLLLVTGEAGGLRELPGGFRPAHAIGGLSGAAIVFVTILTVRSLGAGGVAAALVLGQLVVAAIADRFGWLGLEGSPITLTEVAGFALLLAGTALVTWG